MANYGNGHWTNRVESVRLDSYTFSTILPNTCILQGCGRSRLHYSVYTHRRAPVHDSESIIKSGDDTMVVGLIRDDDETAYRKQVRLLQQPVPQSLLRL